jgi:hypothetical protein
MYSVQSESARSRPTHLKLVFNTIGEVEEEVRSSVEGPLLTLCNHLALTYTVPTSTGVGHQ